MRLPLFIAKRYFQSKKRKNFIHFISRVSMIGVAVGTAALIIVLSVFNGLEDVLLGLYRGFDPDLKVTPESGKTFAPKEEQLRALEQIPEIAAFTEVIEEKALVQYRDTRQVFKVKGLNPNFLVGSPLESHLRQGSEPMDTTSRKQALLGRGVQLMLSVSMDDPFNPIRIYFPRNLRPGILNPADAYNTLSVFPAGVFAIEREFDDQYILLPLDRVERLTQYGNRRTALEIRLQNPGQSESVKRRVKAIFGEEMLVLDNREQHAPLLRALKIEKLFVFITFSFILLIASFNIFFSLSLLAIEKQKDIAMLYAMGGTSSLVRKIFLYQGTLIAFSGAFVGLVLGVAVCLIQEQFGIVSMGAESSIINAYPIKLQLTDLLYVVAALISITFLISFRPALMAGKIEVSQQL
jgi:lipoprotein-releasing system permease protein